MESSRFAIRFILAALATWRVTHLLAAEDGPADIIVRLRSWLGDSFAGKLMDCFYCLSLWIGAASALFVTTRPLDWLMTWLAASGAACLLERATHRAPVAELPGDLPSGGVSHVLRSETSAFHGQPVALKPPEADLAVPTHAAAVANHAPGIDGFP